MKLPSKHFYRAFTLIELLICMAIIAVLSAITVGAIAVALNAAKKSRAQGEIQAMEIGLNHFNEDNGFYPDSTFITVSGSLTNHTGSYDSNPADYRTASSVLFLALMGKTAWDLSATNVGTAYVEVKANWVFTNGSANSSVISSSHDSYINSANFGVNQGAMKDPWGKPYGYYYSPPPSGSPNTPSAVYNQNLFDIWTTEGAVQTNTTYWVANWTTHQ